MTSLWTAHLQDHPAAAVDLSTQTALLPLPGLAVLRLSGPDSHKFLQGQTTTDFRDVEAGQVRRGAICSLKGRVLFSFIAIPEGENVALVLPDDQLDAALAHLKKYAVFSKTSLSDARSTVAVLGVAGPEAGVLVSRLLGTAPLQDAVCRNAEGLQAIRMAEEERFLLLLPAAALPALLTQNTQPLADENSWWQAEIRAGMATVFAAARDLFQPQELNYHAIAAVSYNKGCYTGQEVVARLYFRGKLKQRLYRLEGHSPEPAPGREIFSGEQHVGDVVMSSHQAGHIAVLAVVKNAAIAAGGLRLAGTDSALENLPLPYALPADKEE